MVHRGRWFGSSEKGDEVEVSEREMQSVVSEEEGKLAARLVWNALADSHSKEPQKQHESFAVVPSFNFCPFCGAKLR